MTDTTTNATIPQWGVVSLEVDLNKLSDLVNSRPLDRNFVAEVADRLSNDNRFMRDLSDAAADTVLNSIDTDDMAQNIADSIPTRDIVERIDMQDIGNRVHMQFVDWLDLDDFATSVADKLVDVSWDEGRIQGLEDRVLTLIREVQATKSALISIIGVLESSSRNIQQQAVASRQHLLPHLG